MASIFTWESDTPRVSSPWLNAGEIDDLVTGVSDMSTVSTSLPPAHKLRQRRKIRRLQAEPQEGPVEYKLHLLLRPRRHFRHASTGNHVSGSNRAAYASDTPGRTVSESVAGSTKSMGTGVLTPTSSSTLQTRQHRLQQLTTQLLWRLQQSSPHHTSSATNIIFPSFPESSHELAPPQKPGKLLHGLEESQGALYEIGVSDDGSLIGLAEDELNESLNNLRAMAACLGCTVELLRKELVGECEWIEGDVLRKSPLCVAEAFIKPCLQSQSTSLPGNDVSTMPTEAVSNLMLVASEQLRIALTGPTMSGKSTLLGTLTTSTLDTGRGKIRLGMLKHQHEINSGLTSSVTQEMLGYQDLPDGDVEVINYAAENCASWVDIHAASADSRVVFICDSAGHPRFRRTIIRSLVGWAPHWTLLCIPANDTQGNPEQTENSTQPLVSGIADVDLAGAQLDLCLRLALPLVVVITKLDLATRSSLRATLTRILDSLKAAGRKPSIFANAAMVPGDCDLTFVQSAVVDRACDIVVPLLNDSMGTVPIVLTSAVQGTGISNLHALLHELPLPSYQHATTATKAAVFNVEDVYSRPAEAATTVVGGHMRSGEIEVGAHLVLGPFVMQDHFDDSEDSDERSLRRNSRGRLPASRSFPGALPDIGRFALPGQEWKQYRVTSIRNLRLPVHALSAGQVGTIAISPVQSSSAAVTARIRKGMILTPVQPATARTFLASFSASDFEGTTVGSHVVVYIASIRASAKVVSAQIPHVAETPHHDDEDATSAAPFNFDNDDKPSTVSLSKQSLHVTLTFDSSREFIVLGDKVLVMPGGGPALFGGQERGQKGLAGLDGFVGKILEILG